MSKKNNIITIDLDQWQTQQEYANNYISKEGKKGCTVQYVSKLVRYNKIDNLPIPELGIVLVKR